MDGSWHKLFPLTLPGKDGKLKLFREVWANGFNKVVTTFCPETPEPQENLREEALIEVEAVGETGAASYLDSNKL